MGGGRFSGLTLTPSPPDSLRFVGEQPDLRRNVFAECQHGDGRALIGEFYSLNTAHVFGVEFFSGERIRVVTAGKFFGAEGLTALVGDCYFIGCHFFESFSILG